MRRNNVQTKKSNSGHSSAVGSAEMICDNVLPKSNGGHRSAGGSAKKRCDNIHTKGEVTTVATGEQLILPR